MNEYFNTAYNLTVLLVIFNAACTYFYTLRVPSVKEVTDFSKNYDSLDLIEQRQERKRAYGARFVLFFCFLVVYGLIASGIAKLVV